MSVISKKRFLQRMDRKWKSRNIATNTPLKAAWGVLCDTLNEHAFGERPNTWSVIPLPTGTGKTEGLVSYCAELSTSAPKAGVLIVTRFTDEADRIVQSINEEAGRVVAITQHHKLTAANKPDIETIERTQILVITHSAYKKALALSAHDVDSLHNKYTNWQGGERLVVVDEVLSTDDQIRVDIDTLRMIRHSIPLHIEHQHKQEIKHIDRLLGKFFELIDQKKPLQYISKNYWHDYANPRDVDIAPLIEALDDYGDEEAHNSFGRVVAKITKSYRKEALTSFDEITRMEGFYFERDNQFCLHATRLLLPADVPSAVILDATAKENIHYQLFGSFVRVIDIPAGVRDYSNVRLDIIYGLPVGKSSMTNNSPKFFSALHRDYLSDLPMDETLVCVHKNNREKMLDAIPELKDENLAHWGNMDGKNDWSNLSNMIVLGLPYLGQMNAECAALAMVSWMHATGHKYHEDLIEYDDHSMTFAAMEPPEDLWQDYEQSHLIVSVIQAINRIRCRKAVDEQGRCAPVRIALFLGSKNGNQSKYQIPLIAALKSAMPPDLVINEQEGVFDGADDTSSHTKQQLFLKILDELNPGEHSAKNVIQRAIDKGISLSTVRRYQSDIMNKADSHFVISISKMGIDYISERGAYGKSKYVKKQQASE